MRPSSRTIGLFAHFDPTWTGGENYIRNLISALSGRDEVKIILYARPEFDTTGLVGPNLEVRKPSVLARHSPAWWSSKIAERVDRRILDPITRIIERDRIDATYLCPVHVSGGRVPNVHWVPDLQHRHLPEMYTSSQFQKCDQVEQRAIARSARVVAGSMIGRDHLLAFQPLARGKIDVLRFAVDVPPDAFLYDPEAVCRRHDLPKRFVLFPGQLWKHKNHRLLFDAMVKLGGGAERPVIVCTGATVDFRHNAYHECLLARRSELGLTSSVRMLGLLPRLEFYALLRQAVAVLNPSLFEGWSTPVEEAKALGVPLLISDIPVHREQAPDHARFFDPRSADDLAAALAEVWKNGHPATAADWEEAAYSNQERQHVFAEDFIRIMTRTIESPSALAEAA